MSDLDLVLSGIFDIQQKTNFKLTNLSGTLSSNYYDKNEVNSLISSFNNSDYVIDTQRTSISGTYMWYRKYKSGWVEQGGYGGRLLVTSEWRTITFPQPFRDREYIAIAQTTTIDFPSLEDVINMDPTKETTYCRFRNGAPSGGHGSNFCWYACGQGFVSNS